MPSEEEEIIIRNGELKKWWNLWLRYYDVILLGTETAPILKVRAWVLPLTAVVLAFVAGLIAG